MSLDFRDRRSAERFAELLDETSGGRRHHGRGAADEELAELVAIGHRLSAARPGVQVDPEFRAGLRAMLVATAERDGIGRTAGEPETEPGGGHAAIPRRGRLGRAAGRRIRARGAIVIGVAAGALAVSGISAASESAAPGDALYGIKRSTEQAQRALAGSDDTLAELSLDFARTRLAEAIGMSDRGELGDARAFAGVLDDMDADTRQGVKLLTESAVARTDTAPLNRVEAFVAAQQQTFATLLPRLSPAKRERAETSLLLVQEVQRRVWNLRTGLACDTVTRDGGDALGPRLRDCMTGTDARTGDQQGTGRGERPGSKKESATGEGDTTVGPEPTAPVDPASSGAATAPDDLKPSTGNRAPAPGASLPAEPGSDQDEGLLGGLLDGVF